MVVNTGGAKEVASRKHGAHSATSGFALVRVDERRAVRVVGAIHMSPSGNVTQDSYDLAEGYADPYAVETFNVMNQLLIAQDKQGIGAQSFPLAATGTPLPTLQQQMRHADVRTTLEIYAHVLPDS